MGHDPNCYDNGFINTTPRQYNREHKREAWNTPQLPTPEANNRKLNSLLPHFPFTKLKSAMMGKAVNVTMCETIKKPPSTHEHSDSSEDAERPLVLKQVLADLMRLTDELGPTHKQVAETWNSLGLIRLHMQHNVQAAVKCHQEALSIYKVNPASSTLEIAVTLNDLGRCFERLSDPKRALEIYEQAAEMVRSDDSIRKTHSVVESVKRAVARLRRS